MFKEKLLNLMKEKNLNQHELSREAKIPVTTINGWLAGGRLPDYNALIKLALFFNVSADFLLGLTDY